IARNIDGLEALSAERIGQEMRKLLSAPDPSAALAGMRTTGVLHAVLPGAEGRWISPIVHVEGTLGLAPNWLCRLTALGGAKARDRLRLSRAEARDHDATLHSAFGPQSLIEISYRLGPDIAQAALLLRAAMAQ